MKKNKTFRIRLQLLTFALLFVVGVIVVYLFIKKFSVGEVECFSQFGQCNSQLSSYLTQQIGQSYIKTKKGIEIYLKKQSVVKEFSTKYEYPDKIIVNVIERKPILSIKVQDGSYFLVSSDYKILGKTQNSSLPALDVTSSNIDTSPEGMSPGFGYYFDLLRYMDLVFGVKTGRLTTESVEFKIDDGPVVFYPKSGDAILLVGALRLISQDLLLKTAEYSLEKPYNQITIDLRYKNPVIK